METLKAGAILIITVVTVVSGPHSLDTADNVEVSTESDKNFRSLKVNVFYRGYRVYFIRKTYPMPQ